MASCNILNGSEKDMAFASIWELEHLRVRKQGRKGIEWKTHTKEHIYRNRNGCEWNFVFCGWEFDLVWICCKKLRVESWERGMWNSKTLPSSIAAAATTHSFFHIWIIQLIVWSLIVETGNPEILHKKWVAEPWKAETIQ